MRSSRFAVCKIDVKMAMWVINPSVLFTKLVVSRSPKLAGHCTLSDVESSSGVAEAVSVPDTLTLL
jgi:hypothetical protein